MHRSASASGSTPSAGAAPAARRAGGRPALRAALAAGGVGVALAATFALYLSPGLALDLGQLMALCGFR